MLNNISKSRLAGGWVAAVTGLMACTVAAGANLTIGAGVLWLVAAAVPPGVMLLLWHGAEPATVAELLYAVNERPKEGRR
jgi:hypothetical protein